MRQASKQSVRGQCVCPSQLFISISRHNSGGNSPDEIDNQESKNNNDYHPDPTQTSEYINRPPDFAPSATPKIKVEEVVGNHLVSKSNNN
jgi:hypothetical protein